MHDHIYIEYQLSTNRIAKRKSRVLDSLSAVYNNNSNNNNNNIPTRTSTSFWCRLDAIDVCSVYRTYGMIVLVVCIAWNKDTSTGIGVSMMNCWSLTSVRNDPWFKHEWCESSRNSIHVAIQNDKMISQLCVARKCAWSNKKRKTMFPMLTYQDVRTSCCSYAALFGTL